ncbi:hypothetical protein HID58_095883 [Brassica napus]|uniref:Uncharacterized protein n=1 Tax=Brassica napus TaxID=3708 RepID=A0ABQ7X4I3_BRANA|nr:hypothetical protein HID58_095883 [Brassica napus]
MQDLTSAAAYYHHQSMLMMAAKQQQQPELPEQQQLNNLKDKTVAVPDQKPNSEEESQTKLVEEEKMTGQEMDPTRMLYGLPVGDPRFTSLLGADVGISYETGSNWYPGIHLVWVRVSRGMIDDVREE